MKGHLIYQRDGRGIKHEAQPQCAFFVVQTWVDSYVSVANHDGLKREHFVIRKGGRGMVPLRAGQESTWKTSRLFDGAYAEAKINGLLSSLFTVPCSLFALVM